MSDAFTTGDRDVVVAAILAHAVVSPNCDDAALVERFAQVLRALRQAGGTSRILQSAKVPSADPA